MTSIPNYTLEKLKGLLALDEESKSKLPHRSYPRMEPRSTKTLKEPQKPIHLKTREAILKKGFCIYERQDP